jgi:soluble lytic murein transglycosylase-like protein
MSPPDDAITDAAIPTEGSLMRFSRSVFACVLLASIACAASMPAAAGAAVPHTVQPGESLWSIAAANNFTTRALAAYNGLAVDARLVTGKTIQIPAESEAAAAVGAGAPAAARSTSTGTASTASSSEPGPLGGYTVRSGDTLSSIAARSGVTVRQLAWMNGVDPQQLLRIGTALKLPTGSQLAAPSASQPTPSTVPQAPPNPSPARLTSTQVGQVAAQHGVSPSLASAVAWQESGFNNSAISSANARGVMQVLPGTWTWVQQNLAQRVLDPNSAIDNVSAGSMYLAQLIRDAGGSESLAAAYYYQGEASVRAVGMLPTAQRYVANVLALRARFGG